MKKAILTKEERSMFNAVKSAQRSINNNAYKQDGLSISQACKFVASDKPVKVWIKDETGAFVQVELIPRAEFIADLEREGINISPTFSSGDVYNVFKAFGKFTMKVKGVERPVLTFTWYSILSAYKTQARELNKRAKK